MRLLATISFALLLASFVLAPVVRLEADSFGTGENAFRIDFVTIGDPGNPADTLGTDEPIVGSVPYSYRIGKFEISREIIEKANEAGGLDLSLRDMSLLGGNGPNRPATGVSWYEATRFVNWLNTSTGHPPAYKENSIGRTEPWQPGDEGFDPDNQYRNPEANYFLPSYDEWHKAAYYDPATGDYFVYPTGSNDTPVPVAFGTEPGTAVYMQDLSAGPANVNQAGGLSPYGTMGQGGNVADMHETNGLFTNDFIGGDRQLRGSRWSSSNIELRHDERRTTLPTAENSSIGFRVASTIPEPSTVYLILVAATALLIGTCGRSAARRLNRFSSLTIIQTD